MSNHQPDFWDNLRRELAAGRQWMDRAVVLAFAAATGLVVVGFTLLAESASALHARLFALDPFGVGAGNLGLPLGLGLSLLWTPLLTVAVLA